jgi:hypothetical protein
MKQLYPPPDQDVVEAGPEEVRETKRAPLHGRRPSHGALFGDSDATPPPKGKVRQLYPPPPEEDFASDASGLRGDTTETLRGDVETIRGYDTPSESPFESQTPFETFVSRDSIFISDEDEREERRRRARERADQRQRDENLEGDAPARETPREEE